MTDWADEIARRIIDVQWDEKATACSYWYSDIAQALRDAEKAGLERAAVICKETAKLYGWNYHLPSVGRELAAAIRAAKETKE